MNTQIFGPDGALLEEWNDATRTYTDYRTAPASSRPYTTQENAEADVAIAAATRDANKKALLDGLAAVIANAIARQAEYQTIIDATNSTINSSPASYLKTVARQGKRTQRDIVRLARLAGNIVDSADTGTD